MNKRYIKHRFSLVYLKEFFLIENNPDLNYKRVKDKGHRPFLYLKELTNNKFLFAKMSTYKDNYYQKNKNGLFIINFKNRKSVIDFNSLYVFSKEELEKAEIDINNKCVFPKNKRNELTLCFASSLIGKNFVFNFENLREEFFKSYINKNFWNSFKEK